MHFLEEVNISAERSNHDEKERDKLMRGKRKKPSNLYINIKAKQIFKLQLAKWLINDLKRHGPAGLVHMEALSSVTGKPIRVWNSENTFHQIINKNKVENECPVDVEFHEQDPGSIGHWTLFGNKEPLNTEMNLNGCLFSVIADQTGNSASNLRTDIVNYLTNNINQFTISLDQFLPSNGKKGMPLMIGGARYTGRSPKAAKIILDKSQNVLCHGCRYTGHPRGHASDKTAVGPEDSVENYSRSTATMKSGFLSKQDQDTVAHFALKNNLAQRAMERLNSGTTNEAVTIDGRMLEHEGCRLPKMKEWYDGEEYTDEMDIYRVTLVMRHHAGKQNDPDADVFVHTFYPRSS